MEGLFIPVFLLEGPAWGNMGWAFQKLEQPERTLSLEWEEYGSLSPPLASTGTDGIMGAFSARKEVLKGHGYV